MTAAAALAALPPRPLASGRPFRRLRATPRRSPATVNRACAAMAAVFFVASRGSRPSSPTMSSMRTPPGARRTVTSSPGEASANPSTSKPHATFETVAGANAVTGSMRRLSYPGGGPTFRIARESSGSGIRRTLDQSRIAARIPNRPARRHRQSRPARNRRCPAACDPPRS